MVKQVLFGRRQLPRFPFSTEVRVDAYGQMFTTRSLQLGSGGMSLETAPSLSIAQPLHVSFVLPGGRQIAIAAVVRWKQEQQVGLRFDPCGDLAAIREWVEKTGKETAVPPELDPALAPAEQTRA